MLQALELNGFKSFADRTRFDFPQGTTVVVGPNGSGKSNVVDAVKWVLGAQSVKALRGKEMTDVIFSGSKNRRPAGGAEVTLLFDNSSRSLNLDEDDISVSRRVLRSGESEYLINRQPCRLRDIHDLLARIGVSSGSYTIIEQGKVDALLQASAQERRGIFEEAAGISRFRAKRQEAERRLQRIEQNLLRLSDIVEEVGSRLKTVRSQAGRAKKYNELRQQLHALQLQVAVHRCREIDAESQSLRQQLETISEQEQSLQQELDVCEQALQQAESADRESQLRLRQLASQDAAVRERLATCQSDRGSQVSRHEETERQCERLARESLLLTSKIRELDEQLEQVDSQLSACQLHHQRQQHEAAARTEEFRRCEGQFTAIVERQERAATQLEGCRQELSELHSQLAGQCSKLESVQEAVRQHELQIEPVRLERDQLARDAAELETAQRQSDADLQAAATKAETLRLRLSHDRSRLQKTQSLLAETQGQLSGSRERTAVLEELEHRLGGMNAGARETLRRAQEDPTGPLSGVRGVVADLFHVDADTAPLVEIALGERASHIVLSDARPLTDCLAELDGQWRDRTSFLRMDVPAPVSAIDRVDLSSDPGVMGRADSFVETESQFTPLASRLLGRFWIVDTIATALRLAEGRGRGLSFVTLAGEAVTGDGVLSVGPHQAHRGLLSRRNELARLKGQVEELQQRAAQLHSEVVRLETQIVGDEEQSQSAALHLKQCTRRHSDVSLRAASAVEKLQHAEQRLSSIEQQLEQSAAAASSAAEQSEACRDQIAENYQLQQSLQDEIAGAAAEKQALESQIQVLRQANIDARIELARHEQRRAGLQAHVDQVTGDRAERRSQLTESEQRLESLRRQQRELYDGALAHSAEIATLCSDRDRLQADLTALDEQLRAAQQQRDAGRTAAVDLRQALGKRQEQRQTLELALLQLKQRREAAASPVSVKNVSGDSGALQTAMQAAPDELQLDVADAEAQIEQLQSQLQVGGSVNLEALDELQTLEDRHAALSTQYVDMQTARTRLAQINARMNVRCAQLYLETIENVRQHFQEVFRALFGGGEADILLESSEDDDPLSAGVSIVARPPGKQPRSISLLSGGEKTLTCVALLLAIFRNRPSPFCVLDEVDAALDETNIDRFLTVLNKFMGSTQFIVVTHSKRTMTCADTLYGVTMQESGVSKRVSVRFEDVGQNGEIRVAGSGAAANLTVPSQKRAA